jgi:hypothetical protein
MPSERLACVSEAHLALEVRNVKTMTRSASMSRVHEHAAAAIVRARKRHVTHDDLAANTTAVHVDRDHAAT